MTLDPWQVAAGGAAVGLVGGLLVPPAIARLPEPPPDPEPGEGVELTPAQLARRSEPPKELFADLARRPWLRPTAVVVGAVLGGLVGLTSGATASALWLLPLVPVGVLLGVVDWRTRLLPSVVVLPATLLVVLAGGAAWAVAALLDDRVASDLRVALVRGLVGLVVARALFWLLWFVRQAGMGFGDVRLSALLGFVLAWEGWAAFAVGLYAAFLLFGVPGLVLAIVRRDRSVLRRAYPFGPFMLGGALLGVLLGATLLPGLAAG